jgi:hypothetical protein
MQSHLVFLNLDSVEDPEVFFSLLKHSTIVMVAGDTGRIFMLSFFKIMKKLFINFSD